MLWIRISICPSLLYFYRFGRTVLPFLYIVVLVLFMFCFCFGGVFLSFWVLFGYWGPPETTMASGTPKNSIL